MNKAKVITISLIVFLLIFKTTFASTAPSVKEIRQEIRQDFYTFPIANFSALAVGFIHPSHPTYKVFTIRAVDAFAEPCINKLGSSINELMDAFQSIRVNDSFRHKFIFSANNGDLSSLKALVKVAKSANMIIDEDTIRQAYSVATFHKHQEVLLYLNTLTQYH